MSRKLLKLRTEETEQNPSLYYDAADNGWGVGAGWVLVERASKHDSPSCDADYFSESEALARLTASELAEGEAFAAQQTDEPPELFERLPVRVAATEKAYRRAA